MVKPRSLLDWAEWVFFWTLFWRVWTYDALCILPRQPISWLVATRHRVLKHMLKGPVYSQLSYFFDADITPHVILVLVAFILIRRFSAGKASTFNLYKHARWKKWFLLFSLVVVIHKFLVLHNYRVELLQRLDKHFPSPAGHHHIKHLDDHLHPSKAASLVSLTSVFSSLDSSLDSLYELEHNLVFSISKSLSNFYASRETIPAANSVVYKRFEPLPESNCGSSLWKLLGLKDLSQSRNEMDNGRLHMEIYEPQRSKDQVKFEKSPVVIFTHGGGWRAGDKSVFQMNYAGGIPAFLLHNGLTVVSISYRLWCTGVGGREMREDLLDAIDFIKKQAALGDHEWAKHIDGEKIVLLGSSAGGHLSLLAGMTKNDSAIKGVVSLYGPTEMRRHQVHTKANTLYELLHRFFYVKSTDNLCQNVEKNLTEEQRSNRTLVKHHLEKCFADLSPVHHVHAKAPPVLTVHGQCDPIVPVSHAYWLHDALDEHKVANALIDVPCSNHDCDIMCSSPCSQAALYGMERFLNSVLA